MQWILWAINVFIGFVGALLGALIEALKGDKGFSIPRILILLFVIVFFFFVLSQIVGLFMLPKSTPLP